MDVHEEAETGFQFLNNTSCSECGATVNGARAQAKHVGWHKKIEDAILAAKFYGLPG